MHQDEHSLRALEREYDQFTYIVSHDLNEPLRAIETFTQFFVDDYGSTLPSEANDLLAIIQQSSDKLKQQLDALLYYSRIRNRPFESAHIALVELVRDCIAAVVTQFEADSIAVHLPDNCPLVQGDGERLSQAITALVKNALTYNESETKHLTLSWAQNKPQPENGEPAHLVFCLTDNGIGIAKSKYEEIFKLFRKVHRPRRFNDDGLGTGLTLARRIIEKHGGALWCESTVGEGSRFYFTLPTACSS